MIKLGACPAGALTFSFDVNVPAATGNPQQNPNYPGESVVLQPGKWSLSITKVETSSGPCFLGSVCHDFQSNWEVVYADDRSSTGQQGGAHSSALPHTTQWEICACRSVILEALCILGATSPTRSYRVTFSGSFIVA